jgi:small GTP-binding protein
VSPGFRTGYLAVIGRPNVGKSTLTNRLVGAKVSITSKKAQTTRHRIHGIFTTDDAQFIFVDTPGFQMAHKNALNRLMNRSVTSSFADVDVILLVVEAGNWGNGEAEILRMLPAGTPVLLVINKIDRLADKAELLPFIGKLAALHGFAEILPVSAEKGSARTRCWPPRAPTCRKAPRCSRPTTSPTATNASSPRKSCAKSCSATSARNCPTASPSRSRSSSRKATCAASTPP